MTLKEAYEKAKANSDYKHLQSCRDFGEFWGFIFSPIDNPNAIMGGGELTVNKNTGELGAFCPPMNFELDEKAIKIPLDRIITSVVAPRTHTKSFVRPSIPARQKLAYA